jgi:hypothetical protein
MGTSACTHFQVRNTKCFGVATNPLDPIQVALDRRSRDTSGQRALPLDGD